MTEETIYKSPYYQVNAKDGEYLQVKPLRAGAATFPVTRDRQVVLLEINRPAIGRTLLEIPRGMRDGSKERFKQTIFGL
jgi:hypothetical protein